MTAPVGLRLQLTELDVDGRTHPETYLTNPAEEPDVERYETELGFRLADG